MNIVLYGVSADIAEKIAGRYGLKVINTVEEIDGMGSVLLVPPKRDLRQLLAFYNAMAVREDKIDAVVVCGFESCAASSTVQYCPSPGKFFPPGRDSEPGNWTRNRNSAGLPTSLCGSDQSLAFFFPHLGRMSRNISKFIPGIGRPSTETYSSSKRFLTAALAEKSAQRAENSFSSVTSFIR